MLDTFLPGEIGGYSREIVDNYAYVGSDKAGAAANLFSMGAYVNVRYRATDRSRRSRTLSITDMTTFGAAYSDQLLQEVAQTGGENELRGGRVQRTVTEAGTQWIVTEFETSTDPNRQYGHYEVLLGKRYKLMADTVGLSLQEIRDWVATLDLAGLEARAKANKPIE